MHLNLLYNQTYLKEYIEKYDGKFVHGILVTKSGILAAAHLGGCGSIIRWIKTGYSRKDLLGTSITSYIKKFSGYSLKKL